MESEELVAIRARVEAASDAYFDHLAPRCSHTFVGEGLNCGLSSGHGGPHSRLTPSNDGWRYVNEARQDVPRLCDEVARLTAEVERLSAMVPRWTESKGGGVWTLAIGKAHHLATVERHYGNFRAWTRREGEPHPTPCAIESSLHVACRAACERLNLPNIPPPETP